MRPSSCTRTQALPSLLPQSFTPGAVQLLRTILANFRSFFFQVQLHSCAGGMTSGAKCEADICQSQLSPFGLSLASELRKITQVPVK